MKKYEINFVYDICSCIIWIKKKISIVFNEIERPNNVKCFYIIYVVCN